MITVYTQPECRPCKRVVGWFNDSGVDVEVVDVTKDALAVDFIKRSLGANSVPVIHDDVTGDYIVGYHPTEIKNLIERYRYYNGIE